MEKKQDDYISRLAEKELDWKLHTSGAVLVTGPKFCGKSTLCDHFAKSSYVLNTDSQIAFAEFDPKLILIGDKPHLIDEWQKVPDIWNQIKMNLDKSYEFGKYILTGSTTPLEPGKIKHSGTGRFSKLELRTFSLFEAKNSIGSVSLGSLFDKSIIEYEEMANSMKDATSLEDILFYMCRGGWPIAVKAEKEYAVGVARNYYEGLFTVKNEDDDYAAFLKRKNIDLLKLILKEYARNISSEAKKARMIDDIIYSGERKKLDEATFDSYVKVLKDLFIVYDMPSWNLNLRSSVSVRSAPIRHFFDTSIALAALNIGPNDLLNDLNSLGLFFEDFAIHDLFVYSSSLNASLKHYRDSNDMEVDAIVELPDGRYGAIEIKIASEKNIEHGIKTLNAFEKAMERNFIKKPSFKMVLTSHGHCYVKDGVNIVPITCLKD